MEENDQIPFYVDVYYVYLPEYVPVPWWHWAILLTVFSLIMGSCMMIWLADYLEHRKPGKKIYRPTPTKRRLVRTDFKDYVIKKKRGL